MTPPTQNTSPDTQIGSIERIERRKRLRLFQSELVERMQAAREQAEAHDNRLGVLIGQQRWLLNLQEIGEIVPISPITPVPLTQDWYLGLLNIRGNLISVIDFARYQGLAPTEIEPANRIITFAPSLNINCALLVSRVMGLRNVAEMQELSPSENNNTPWVSQGFRDQGSLDWIGLSLSAIAQDPRFLQIGL